MITDIRNISVIIQERGIVSILWYRFTTLKIIRTIVRPNGFVVFYFMHLILPESLCFSFYLWVQENEMELCECEG